MDEESKEIFEHLKQEVILLHARWAVYKQLYASGKDNVDLLNRHASNVFYLYQFLLIDDFSLTLSKLTDSSSTYGQDNLSLEQLILRLEEGGSNELTVELRRRFAELKNSCEKFRLLRNKRIAHIDLSHRLQVAEEQLPVTSREDIKISLKLLSDFMNKIEENMFGAYTDYDGILTPLDSDGDALLRALRRADEAI